MKEILNDIKLSPIFNFSLSSKELFHSNFLFWLCKEPKTKDWVGQYFARRVGWDTAGIQLIKPERETENIDLMFDLVYPSGDRKKILIENKVKSLPYRSQLDEYAAAFSMEGKGLILLSLSSPDFVKDGIYDSPGGYRWHHIKYIELLEWLNELIQIPELDTYHLSIIKDYGKLIKVLVEIESRCRIQIDELFDFSGHSICKLLRDKEVKLHDLYLKKKHEQFAFLIYQQLLAKPVSLTEFGSWLQWSDDKDVSVAHGMTRSEGLTDIKMKIDNQFLLGIQIQGSQYRLFAEFPAKCTYTESVLEKLVHWKFFTFPDEENKVVYPKKRDYNKFGSTFFYKYVRVNTLTIGEVAGLILEDFDRILHIKYHWVPQ
jgi:hypothetical protein